jgi:hypothetical protein
MAEAESNAPHTLADGFLGIFHTNLTASSIAPAHSCCNQTR